MSSFHDCTHADKPRGSRRDRIKRRLGERKWDEMRWDERRENTG